MRDVEINSDKYTALGVIFFLAFVLFVLVSDLRALASHRATSFDLHFFDYPAAIFNVYVVVTVYRDSKLRNNYPYGLAGIGLMALDHIARIASHWVRVSHENHTLWVTSVNLIGVFASGLVLTEGVRWFTRRVTLRKQGISS